jgi:hypothetical protein
MHIVECPCCTLRFETEDKPLAIGENHFCPQCGTVFSVESVNPPVFVAIAA